MNNTRNAVVYDGVTLTQLQTIFSQATLNGHLFGGIRKALLLGPEEDLAAAFVEQAGLTQNAAGAIVGLSQSTVSRRLRERSQAARETSSGREAVSDG